MYKLCAAAWLVLNLYVSYTQPQNQQLYDYTTPVPILKQIDRHNDDGSYTYGYEAADKSFKIETKYPNGEVYGKYGYVDDQGKVREIEYGASKRGFEPAGSDINVPPPTLSNSQPYPLGPNELDDGQYREDPSVYYKDQKFNRNHVPASQFSLNGIMNHHRQSEYHYQPPTSQQHHYYNAAHRNYNQQPMAPIIPHQSNYYRPPPTQSTPSHYQPSQSHTQYNHQPTYNAYNNAPNNHHPAIKNIDIWSGSYSIDYTGRK